MSERKQERHRQKYEQDFKSKVSEWLQELPKPSI
jgi:hypothetical protein